MDVGRAFEYAEREPPEALRDRVWAGWSFARREPTTDGGAHVVWPDGCFGLVGILAPGAPCQFVLMGPRLAPHEVQANPGVLYFGVRFHPWAGGAMLGVDPLAWRSRLAPLATVHPSWSAELARAAPVPGDDAPDWSAFDRWLESRARAADAIDEVARRVAGRIVASGGTESVAHVARALGLGVRQLQRRFRAATGLTPKEFARVRRWRTALAGALEARNEIPWSRIAAAAGYADQAHLTRESAELAGETPSGVARRLRAIAHTNVRP